eukprot:TRINITY_DN79789_c0_g1_i1.p1 TRINITY_DN79789_c0_g1~~TRINITY_DN79789_c0_g1_i1.p1  ORF type:complete len:595 (+),score=80.92 TRINITY_DN79789_c0_g1_i1:70-1854(+)
MASTASSILVLLQSVTAGLLDINSCLTDFEESGGKRLSGLFETNEMLPKYQHDCEALDEPHVFLRCYGDVRAAARDFKLEEFPSIFKSFPAHIQELMESVWFMCAPLTCLNDPERLAHAAHRYFWDQWEASALLAKIYDHSYTWRVETSTWRPKHVEFRLASPRGGHGSTLLFDHFRKSQVNKLKGGEPTMKRGYVVTFLNGYSTALSLEILHTFAGSLRRSPGTRRRGIVILVNGIGPSVACKRLRNTYDLRCVEIALLKEISGWFEDNDTDMKHRYMVYLAFLSQATMGIALGADGDSQEHAGSGQDHDRGSKGDVVSDADDVIITDSRDVYFQTDPFDARTPPYAGEAHVVVAAELSEVVLGDCQWHMGACYKCVEAGASISPQACENIKDKPILNNGFILGSVGQVKRFLRKWNQIMLKSWGSVCNDQAMFNVVLYSALAPATRWVVAPAESSPYCSVGRVSFLRVNAKGLVLNRLGRVCSIVHQYDRWQFLEKLARRWIPGKAVERREVKLPVKLIWPHDFKGGNKTLLHGSPGTGEHCSSPWALLPPDNRTNCHRLQSMRKGKGFDRFSSWTVSATNDDPPLGVLSFT